jgi:beta-lactam-binding protein with PASTA domain
MPQVWHLSLEEAKAALDAVGIPYRISRAQNQVIPEGHLFSVAPVPGTIMRSGMEAVLNVSHGPPVLRDGA